MKQQWILHGLITMIIAMAANLPLYAQDDESYESPGTPLHLYVPAAAPAALQKADLQIPPAVTVHEAPTPPTTPPDESTPSIKIKPTLSGVIYNGKNQTYDASLTPGIQLEFPVSTLFALALGFNYTKIGVTEVKRDSYNWYYSWSNQNYGINQMNREINGTDINIEAIAKLYIPTKSKMRPYAGVGLAYDRLSLEFAGTNQSQMPGQYYNYYSTYSPSSYGKESYTSSYTSGVLNIGLEYLFTKNVGLDVGVKMCKRLHDFTTQNQNYNSSSYFNQDQRLLNVLGEDLGSANRLMLSAGILVSF